MKEKVNSISKKQLNLGITLIALVVTIVVLLILSGITVSIVISDDGIIERAEETKLRVDYSVVKRGLEIYKLNQELISEDGILTDEALIGSLYKKIEVSDTKRELVAIADFEKIGVKPIYGKGIEKIIKDDNNSLTTEKQVDTLNTLRDIYAVDLTDGSLYYINGDQLYTEDGKMVEVAENGTTINKYEIETVNQKWYEVRKFKTKWDVTLGETEGSSTYSTVVLPVNVNSVYDATIEWGDGTSTTVQHRGNHTPLTAAQLTEALTHNYTIAEGQNTIYEISISGTYSAFYMNSQATKLKLIGIEQWGDVNLSMLGFGGSTNLEESIPTPNLDTCFKNIINMRGLFENCKKLTGSIPKGFFKSATNLRDARQLFNGCSGLTGSIPSDLFEGATSITTFESVFQNCTGLTGTIPSNLFADATNAYDFNNAFWGCKNLTGSIPADLFKNNTKIKSFGYVFLGCKGLSGSIPPTIFEGLTNLTNVGGVFRGCTGLTGNIPNGLFKDQKLIEMSDTFMECTGLTGIEEDIFANQTNLTGLSEVFRGCSNLTTLPQNFTIPSSVTNVSGMFYDCSKVKGTITIKGNPTSYKNVFNYATATKSDGTLTVNYTEACTNIDEIIATKGSSNTRVVKGSLVE